VIVVSAPFPIFLVQYTLVSPGVADTIHAKVTEFPMLTEYVFWGMLTIGIAGNKICCWHDLIISMNEYYVYTA
jgi:hypothetical protein